MTPVALRLNSLLLPLTFAVVACQDPAAVQPDVSAQFDVSAAGCDIDSDWCGFTDVAGSYRMVMSGFDSDALTITGVNRRGASVAAQLTIGTEFKPGLPPNPIIPTDPLLPPNPVFPNDPLIVALLQDYENALSGDLGGDGSTIYTAVGNLAAAGVAARIWIDQSSGVVKAFRPLN